MKSHVARNAGQERTRTGQDLIEANKRLLQVQVLLAQTFFAPLECFLSASVLLFLCVECLLHDADGRAAVGRRAGSHD